MSWSFKVLKAAGGCSDFLFFDSFLFLNQATPLLGENRILQRTCCNSETAHAQERLKQLSTHSRSSNTKLQINLRRISDVQHKKHLCSSTHLYDQLNVCIIIVVGASRNFNKLVSHSNVLSIDSHVFRSGHGH